MREDKNTSGYLLAMVIVSASMFFGTAGWIVFHNSAGEEVRWVSDVFSAFLFILLFFWLLVLEGFRGEK